MDDCHFSYITKLGKRKTHAHSTSNTNNSQTYDVYPPKNLKHVISYFTNKIKSWHVLSRKSTHKSKSIVMLINVDIYSKIGHDHLNSWPTSQNQTC